jgi:hypothetical protein
MGIDVWIQVPGKTTNWDQLEDEDVLKDERRFAEILAELTTQERMLAEFTGPHRLRETFGGGPYATKMLCREAFEAEDRRARIPASVLRERLTNVTSPASRHEPGDALIEEFVKKAEEDGGVCERFVGDARTDPMTVEEAIQRRYRESPDEMEQQLAKFRAFVEFAEAEEARTGEPCLIRVSG